MPRSIALALVRPAVCVLLLASACRTYAETEAKKEPATLEEQLAQLRAAFAEAVQTRDWKMLDLASDGFKAAGLRGKDLELHFLEAERDCALNAGQVYQTRSHLVAWGLAARIRAGDTQALEKLRAQANKKIPPAPDLGQAQKDPVGMQQAYKKFAEAQQEQMEAGEALFCLARLKQPGVLGEVLDRLSRVPSTSQFGFAGNPLVLAALSADPKAGWEGLCELMQKPVERVSVECKIAILDGLMRIGTAWRVQRFVQEGSVDKEISDLLPKDSGVQLGNQYAAILKVWTPSTQEGYPTKTAQVLGMATQFQYLENKQPLIDALEDLLKRLGDEQTQTMAKRYAQMQISALKGQPMAFEAPKPAQPAQAKEPVKPQPPPEDF